MDLYHESIGGGAADWEWGFVCDTDMDNCVMWNATEWRRVGNHNAKVGVGCQMWLFMWVVQVMVSWW